MECPVETWPTASQVIDYTQPHPGRAAASHHKHKGTSTFLKAFLKSLITKVAILTQLLRIRAISKGHRYKINLHTSKQSCRKFCSLCGASGMIKQTINHFMKSIENRQKGIEMKRACNLSSSIIFTHSVVRMSCLSQRVRM